MTAAAAAEALMTYDTCLKERVEAHFAGRSHLEIPFSENAALLREIAGTWTLSLAAAAGGVTERKVLVALARHHLRLGTLKAATSTVNVALDGEETPEPYIKSKEEIEQDERVAAANASVRAQVREMLRQQLK